MTREEHVAEAEEESRAADILLDLACRKMRVAAKDLEVAKAEYATAARIVSARRDEVRLARQGP